MTSFPHENCGHISRRCSPAGAKYCRSDPTRRASLYLTEIEAETQTRLSPPCDRPVATADVPHVASHYVQQIEDSQNTAMPGEAFHEPYSQLCSIKGRGPARHRSQTGSGDER